MHVCCGLTGHLELAKRPDLYGGAVIVGEWESHVIAASEEALPFGVLQGMPLRQAEHLCPQATFIAPDPIAASRLRELMRSISVRRRPSSLLIRLRPRDCVSSSRSRSTTSRLWSRFGSRASHGWM